MVVCYHDIWICHDADAIKVANQLICGDYPELSRWAQCNHKGFQLLKKRHMHLHKQYIDIIINELNL